MKRFIVIAWLILLAGMVFAGGSKEGDGSNTAGSKNTFLIGNGAEPETLDPHFASGVPEHNILLGLFEGLTIPHPETAEAIAGVAESWEIEDSTIYTFSLRKDAVWSDGTPITADQFVDSWLRILNPETAAPYAWFPSLFIKGAQEYNAGTVGPENVAVRALDEHTFQFETVGPLPYTLDALSHYSFAVVPLHVIDAHGSEWTRAENFVGNGPYTLEEWSPQRQVVLTPNEAYWNAGEVKLDKVVYLPVEDDSTMFNMYLNDEISWATTVPTGQIEVAELRDDYHAFPSLATYYYIFNNDVEPLDDPRVRKALFMGINRQLLVDTVTRAGQVPAYSIVPAMKGYPSIDGLAENLTEAKELLSDAGYPNGEGFPELTILYNTNEGHKAIAEFIQQQWLDNLGVNVVLENQEWGTYLATRREGNFDIARAGWIGDYQDPNTFLELFSLGSAMNDASYKSPLYNELLTQAATMSPGRDRMDVLAEAERLLIEKDASIMPIYYYVELEMIDTKTAWGNWWENIMNWHPVGNIVSY